MVRAKAIRRSVTPAEFIRLADRMKNGIASRMNELYDFSISFSSRNGVRRSSMKNTGTQARPSANATGTRIRISSASSPNRISPTSSALMAGGRAPPARSSPARSARNSSITSPATGQATWIVAMFSPVSSEV